MIKEIHINNSSDLSWSDLPSVEKFLIRRSINDNNVEIPVCVITGNKPGPTFSIMSGMHAGEYSGIAASHKIIKTISPDNLKGRLIVIPIISVEAFYQRSMQLSPIDDKEVHFITPGNPKGTYSDLLIDTLFEIVKGSKYLIDMHSGEMVQALTPWIPVPMLGSLEMQNEAKLLAKGYKVNYIEYRHQLSTIPPLCISLAEAGIVNIWVEIGKNGFADINDINTHYDGIISALRSVGCLEGIPDRPKHEILKGKRYQINAKESGFWYPNISEGEIVNKNHLLGKLTDVFGNLISEYRAPKRSLILYYWTSPAINIKRKPYGYDWHSGLVSLLEIDE